MPIKSFKPGLSPPGTVVKAMPINPNGMVFGKVKLPMEIKQFGVVRAVKRYYMPNNHFMLR
jgi:hypothetical protein